MKYLGLGLIILAFFSCKKEAGEGGSATISGSIWVKDYNATFTTFMGEYAGADEDVYLIYGESNETSGYNDKESCDYNGNFSFNFLRTGKYTLYVYSKDSSLQSPSGKITLIKDIEITKRKENVELTAIEIFK